MKRFVSLTLGVLLFSSTLIAQNRLANLNPERSTVSAAGIQTFANDPIEVQQFTLDNGLTVMLSENHDVPQVFGMVVVKAGGKNDPADATGLAHYLEHMLFKGTTTMGTTDYEKEKPYLDKINDLYEELGKTSDEEERKEIQKKINEQSKLAAEFAIPNEFDKLLAQMGGSGVNAFTTEDYTAYHNTFPSNQIERWLEIYSHRFEKPVFRLFQSELETVYEEKNRSMDSPFNSLFELFLKEFYKKHPYGQQTIIGTTEHLKNPPLKKMYKYFEDYYVANNMALVLSGDFNTEKIIPMIKERFGDWRQGTVPEFGNYEETPFNGREFVKVKKTPVKIGLLGFRTPPIGHEDEAAIEVCNNLLSNAAGSGLIDQMMVDGDLLFAGAIPFNYNDYSSTMFIAVPKIVGQKLEKAEELVMAKLDKLRKGEFEDSFLEAVKTSLLNEQAQQWENNQSRVFAMITAYTGNRPWGEVVQYGSRIKALTKDDIVKAANKYYGDNYLCMYSKMGFPKKDKLDKPGFDPVIPKSEEKSEYRKSFEKISSTSPQPRFVDFDKDVTTSKVSNMVTLKSTRNAFNNIFDLEVRYGVGIKDIPALQYTSQYFTYLGTDEHTANELIRKFYDLGCSHSFEATQEEFILSLEGMDEKLPEALALLNEFNEKLKNDEKKVKKVLSDLKGEKKINRSEPGYLSQALQEYVLYGDNSRFKKEFTSKELSSMTGESLIAAYRKAQTYEVTIHYTGALDHQSVQKALQDNFKFEGIANPAIAKKARQRKTSEKTVIYFLDHKKAVQSQLYFNLEGEKTDLSLKAKIDAFNSYFGNDMSSLVFQEIREFRSLAYSAWARYLTSPVPGGNDRFLGYIGCQGDKTMEAMDAMLTLIRDMPEKPERMEIITASLTEEAQSSRPSFRRLIDQVETWEEMGYDMDPNQKKLAKYKSIQFSDITKFQQERLKQQPLVITIVGDGRRFDMDALEKLGEVIKVKQSDLFVN